MSLRGALLSAMLLPLASASFTRVPHKVRHSRDSFRCNHYCSTDCATSITALYTNLTLAHLRSSGSSSTLVLEVFVQTVSRLSWIMEHPYFFSDIRICEFWIFKSFFIVSSFNVANKRCAINSLPQSPRNGDRLLENREVIIVEN